jgi:hypothetical protein
MLKIITILIVTQIVIINCDNTKNETLCLENEGKVNIYNADLIISGIVRRLDRNYASLTYGAFIQIHRILKGHQLATKLISKMKEKKEIHNNDDDYSHNTNLLNGHTIFVNNFGSHTICDSNVRPHQIGIFLLKFNYLDHTFNLNSSIINIVLPKLNSLLIGNDFNNQINDCKC